MRKLNILGAFSEGQTLGSLTTDSDLLLICRSQDDRYSNLWIAPVKNYEYYDDYFQKWNYCCFLNSNFKFWGYWREVKAFKHRQVDIIFILDPKTVSLPSPPPPPGKRVFSNKNIIIEIGASIQKMCVNIHKNIVPSIWKILFLK